MWFHIFYLESILTIRLKTQKYKLKKQLIYALYWDQKILLVNALQWELKRVLTIHFNLAVNNNLTYFHLMFCTVQKLTFKCQQRFV